MKLDFFKRPVVALLTVPAFISLAIGLLPLVTVWGESQFAEGTLSPYVLQIGAESARTLLSTVAAAAMTALSLTYSLVLLVFTLAAGNIGPRLLKRFTSDLVNQVTAGIFGGTFLFALLAILFVENDFVPKVTITLAGALAVLSVLQLIYFVRHVSKSVTIDEEIAEITANLRESLKSKFREVERTEGEDEPRDDDQVGPFEHEIRSPLSGYVGAVDRSALAAMGVEHAFMLRMEIAQGSYVVKGQTLLTADCELDEEVIETCLGHIDIENARSPENEIDFSINLLVEIGLRALSPGVNDTFTALAAVNSISGALSEIVGMDRQPAITRDDEGKARLVLPGISPARLIDQAFSPLRRASANNILMAEAMARALSRLYVLAGNEAETELESQVSLLHRELKHSGQFDNDMDRVNGYFPSDLQKHFSSK